MKSNWRRFAPLGLVIAGIAALAAIALLVIYRNPRGLPFLISVGVFVIGLALFALLDPNRVRVTASGRQVRYGSNALVRMLAFVGMLIVVNLLTIKLVELYPQKTQVDLTEGQLNKLAPETLQTLISLPEPVKAQAFYSTQASSSKGSADEILKRYAENSKGNFTYEFIDPDTHPQAVKDAGVSSGKDAFVSLQMGDKRQLVELVNEQSLTSGLVRLMSDEQRVIYFLTGHGEHNPEDSGDTSLSLAKAILENKNHTVKVLNLRTDTAIPEDANLIVVAGPMKPISEDEISMLADYVAQGGALIAMMDPLFQTEFGDSFEPLTSYLLKTWGVVLGSDFIVQKSQNQAALYVVGEMGQHAIATDSLRNSPPLFWGARSLQVSDIVTNTTSIELVTSPVYYSNCFPSCSWATTNISLLSEQYTGPVDATEQDLIGPVPIAVVSQITSIGAKLVVFGDSDFATDALFDAFGNGDLFVNSVDWAVGQEDLISLTPKDTVERTLSVSPEQMAVTGNVLFLVLVVGLPGLIVILGAVNWLLRRRRG